MARRDPGLNIRLPIELKAWLAGTAVMNRRSQNAEIVFRLQASRAAEENKPSASAGGATAAGQASQA